MVSPPDRKSLDHLSDAGHSSDHDQHVFFSEEQVRSPFLASADSGSSSKRKESKPESAPRSCVNSPVIVAAALLTLQAMFAAYAIITAVVMRRPSGMSPIMFAFLRDVGAASIMVTVSSLANRRVAFPAEADCFKFVVVGVCGMYFGQALFVYGVKYTSAFQASLWQMSQPCFTLLLGVLLGKERLCLSKWHGRLKLAGTALAILGGATALMTAPARHLAPSPAPPVAPVPSTSTPFLPPPHLSTTFPFSPGPDDDITSGDHHDGDVSMTPGAHLDPCQAMGGLLSNGTVPPPLTGGGGSTLLAGNLLLFVADPAAPPFTLTRTDLIALAYVIVAISSLGYGVLAWANSRSSPAFVTAFGPSQVIFSALFSWVFLREAPTLGQLSGGGLLIGGLFMLVRGRSMEQHEGPVGRVLTGPGAIAVVGGPAMLKP
eukprot:jgi/Mesvir1/24443/Mv19969-RA.1